MADLSGLVNQSQVSTVLETAELAKMLKGKWGVQHDPKPSKPAKPKAQMKPRT